MDISIIVAVASNNAIGKDNDLLWHISADLKRFKRLTEGHYIIMGKRTYYSLPKRPLPNRTSLIITDVEGEELDGCIMAYSIEDAINKMDKEKENFIEAIRAYEKALRMNPRKSMAHFSLAEVFYEQFNLQAAANSFRRILKATCSSAGS